MNLKRFSLMFFFLFYSLSFSLLLPSVQAAEKPVKRGTLVFEKSWHDFGEVPVGVQLTHTFRFVVKNGPVNIGVIFTGCGCTTAKLKKKSYQAGEQGEIIATVDTTDFNGMIYKEINVALTGVEVDSVELALIAKVMVNRANKKMDQKHE